MTFGTLSETMLFLHLFGQSELEMVGVGVVYHVSGNLEALNSILDELDSLGVHKIVSVGCLAGRGPNPVECVRRALDFDLTLKDRWDSELGERKYTIAPSGSGIMRKMHPWSCDQIKAAGLSKSVSNWATGGTLEGIRFSSDLVLLSEIYSVSCMGPLIREESKKWLKELSKIGVISPDSTTTVLGRWAGLEIVFAKREGRIIERESRGPPYLDEFRNAVPNVTVQLPTNELVVLNPAKVYSTKSNGWAKFCVVYPERVEYRSVRFDHDLTLDKLRKIAVLDEVELRCY